jgi:hypothetical protein
MHAKGEAALPAAEAVLEAPPAPARRRHDDVEAVLVIELVLLLARLRASDLGFSEHGGHSARLG